jgi:hypothetical protein
MALLAIDTKDPVCSKILGLLLPKGDTGDQQDSLIIRLDTASDEGGMGRILSRGIFSGKHGKGGGGFRRTGYNCSVMCASHCRWQCPLLASTPGVSSTT